MKTLFDLFDEDSLKIKHSQKIDFIGHEKDFLLNYSFSGAKTIYEVSNGIDYFINEFWTSKQRQANSIHEISYRACFKPQLPDFFIQGFSTIGDVVYDPFMGRGTTPLQASQNHRQAIGNDINPLSAMLVRPRFYPPNINDIQKRLIDIKHWNFKTQTNSDLLVFYHEDTLADILKLRAWFIERTRNGSLDIIDEWIRMVCINRLTGHSNGFFSVYTLPPNQAVSIDRQKKINENRNQTPSFRDVYSLILNKTKSLLKDNQPMPAYAPRILTKSAYNTPQIEDLSVDLLITSPPFLDVVDYKSDNWLRCWFANIDDESTKLSIFKELDDWKEFIYKCFVEFQRIMKTGGYIAFEVGEVRGGKIKLEDHAIKAVSHLDFELIGVMVNKQIFTKTANMWGVSNNKQGTNTNRIILYRKK